MKKLFLILMAILPLFVNAQDMPVPALAPDAAIWGYSVLRPAPGGSKVSVLVIDYQYEDASHFVEKVGLARVKKDGKYGFITPENVMAIKARFDYADHFDKEGYCKVIEKGKYGVIDVKGNYLIPAVYDTMDDLFNGWYEVSKGGRWGYVNRKNVYVRSRAEYERLRDAEQ